MTVIKGVEILFQAGHGSNGSGKTNYGRLVQLVDVLMLQLEQE